VGVRASCRAHVGAALGQIDGLVGGAEGGAAAAAAAPFCPGAAALPGCPRGVVLAGLWLAPVTCLAGELVAVFGCLGGLPVFACLVWGEQLVLGGLAPPGVGVDGRGGLVLVLWGLCSEAALDGFCWGCVAGLVGVWVGGLVLVLAAAVVLGPLVSG
jgi:hypothetical protein